MAARYHIHLILGSASVYLEDTALEVHMPLETHEGELVTNANAVHVFMELAEAARRSGVVPPHEPMDFILHEHDAELSRPKTFAPPKSGGRKPN
jgi:hypothetical protein